MTSSMIEDSYLESISQTFQIDYVAITLLSQHKIQHYWNYPKVWQAHYITQGYGLTDYPHSQLSFKPCLWDSATTDHLSLIQKKIMHEAQQVSINSGISFYVSHKNNQRLFVTYASRDSSKILSKKLAYSFDEMYLFAQVLGNIMSDDIVPDTLRLALEMICNQLKNKYKTVDMQQELLLLLNIIKSNSEAYITWKFLPEFEPYINRANELARSLIVNKARCNEVSTK